MCAKSSVNKNEQLLNGDEPRVCGHQFNSILKSKHISMRKSLNHFDPKIKSTLTMQNEMASAIRKHKAYNHFNQTFF